LLPLYPAKLSLLVLLVAPLLGSALCSQQRSEFVGAPLHYEEPRTTDPVARLTQRLENDEWTATWDPEKGWLPAMFDSLEIPRSSQVLVFSKTSFQNQLISPARPRAIYFADDVYVAWIPGAPFVEVTSIDPVQGPTFYTLDQRNSERPVFTREDNECLQCHASPRTRGWPGNLVRSVHPDEKGLPILRSGTHLTTQASPLAERWGGWYVTGTHGDQRHMGNAFAVEGKGGEQVDVSKGANVTDLSERFDVGRYVSPHSDIVALMVMEHQAQMQNLIARASYQGRITQSYHADMIESLGESAEHMSSSIQRRYERAAEDVVDHLLFRGEVALTAPIVGTSSFTEDFTSAGTRDSKGRSLRDLNLETRLFQYPCSYLIDSPAFRSLPEPVLAAIWRQLDEILNGEPGSRDFEHLSPIDRAAIREILVETVPGVPESWRREQRD